MEESEFRRQLLELYPQIMRWASTYQCSYQQPEDLVQDTILLALRHWEKFDPTRSLKTWVYAILRNRFRDTYRTDQSLQKVVCLEGLLRTTVTPPTQHSEYELKKAQATIASLPDELRKPLILSSLEWSQTEIAEELHCPLGTVKSRIRRAKQKLKEELAY